MNAATTAPRRSVMHPRLRARRIEVQRAHGRKRLRRVVTVLVVLTVIALGYLITRSPLLDLDRLEISGANRTSADAVAAASGLVLGQPMTDIDLDRAQQAIVALPWVDTAAVTRHWPNRVSVEISERAPVAALTVDANQWLVLDRTGRVLESRESRPIDLPVLAGVGTTAAPGESISAALPGLALANFVTPDLQTWFIDIASASDGTLSASLQQGITVSFGSQAHLSDKMVGLATVLTRVDLEALEHIDLRVPDAPVLTRQITNAQTSNAQTTNG